MAQSARRWLLIGPPFLWLGIFFLAPFALVAKMSLSRAVLAQPPYAPVFESGQPAAIWAALRAFTLDAYRGLVADPLYLDSYLGSLLMAATATLLILLIAYPFALAIARSPRRARPILLLLAIAPFWTSFLVRVYAWILILKDEGLLNAALLALHVIDTPLHVFASNTAVLIGIVYSYLPFMVLPLYAALEAQDPALREAAADLGATPLACFWRITVPLSWPGIVAGCLIVFIPAVGEFVIPDLLGGSDTLMIGATLWADFFANRDWPAASAAAVVLLALLIGPLLAYERLQARAA